MKLPKNASSYISIWVSLLWVFIVSFGIWSFFHYDLTIEQLIFWLKWFIQDNLMLGIWLFIAVYIIRPLFFITASPFDVFAGMVFWPIYGFIICMGALFLSSMFSYQVWYLTWWIVLERKKIKKLEKLKAKLTKNTFQSVLMMRFIMLPFDLSNYIYGVLHITFWKCIAATTLGVIPATIVFVSAWSAFYGKNIQSFDQLLSNVNYIYLMLSSGFFITIITISHILKKKYRDINL